MKSGFMKVLRMYTDADSSIISKATGIPLSRYKKIENEFEIPTETEIARIAAVLGIKPEAFDYIDVAQAIDESVFVTKELRDDMKLRMTELSADEKLLVMLIRRAKNSNEFIKKLIDDVCESVEKEQ